MLDILFIGAHPDDEGNICGSLIKAVDAGKKVGLLIMTKGESSGKATADERVVEMKNAASFIGVSYLRHLDFPDAGLKCDDNTVGAIIETLVETKPKTVITVYPIDSHPDHVAVSEATDKALFLASLKKYLGNENWDFKQIFYLSLDSSANSKKPDLILDVSDVIDRKFACTSCHKTQGVAIPKKDIAKFNGKLGNFTYGEALYRGYVRQHPIKLKNITSLICE
jgi:LmbE family N-acetylglucosaminyl deacetylase